MTDDPNSLSPLTQAVEQVLDLFFDKVNHPLRIVELSSGGTSNTEGSEDSLQRSVWVGVEPETHRGWPQAKEAAGIEVLFQILEWEGRAFRWRANDSTESVAANIKTIAERCDSIKGRAASKILEALIALQNKLGSNPTGLFAAYADSLDTSHSQPDVVTDNPIETAAEAFLQFSRFVRSGVRPLLLVLDDYSFFLKQRRDSSARFEYDPCREGTQLWNNLLGARGEDNLRDILGKFCRQLNLLDCFFEVHAPVIPCTKEIFDRPHEALNYLPEEIVGHPGLFATVIDMEFEPMDQAQLLPGDRRKRLGLTLLKAIRDRRPDVPHFVQSGLDGRHLLQQAMQAGAAWYFLKGYSHHGESRADPEDQLSPTSLFRRAATFYESLNSERPCSSLSVPEFIRGDDKLLDRFCGRFGLTRADLNRETTVGDRDRLAPALLLRYLFPHAAYVKLERPARSGHSKSGVFFVRPYRTPQKEVEQPEQLRLVKLSDWRSIWLEWKEFREVIRDEVGNYVARIVAGPIFLGTYGGIVYSVVGKPGVPDSAGVESKPVSLMDIIRDQLDGKADSAHSAALLQEISDSLLQPLYRNRQHDKERGRPMRAYYHHVLPHEFIGEWLDEVDSLKGGPIPLDLRPEQLGTKDVVRELVVEKKLREVAKDRCYKVDGLVLDELKIDQAGLSKSCAVFIDPILKTRWKLKLPPSGNQESFRALVASRWARPGIPFTVYCHITETSFDTLWQYLDDTERCLSLTEDLGSQSNGKVSISVDRLLILDLPNPILYFNRYLPRDFRIPLTRSPIHGDLNPDNIQFERTSGASGYRSPWLIDFEKSALFGHTAYDLVKLEIELRTHLLWPLFLDLVATAKQFEPLDEVKELPLLLLAWETALPYNGICDFSVFTEAASKKIIRRAPVSDEVLRRCKVLFDWIAGIRRLASQTFGLTEEEYTCALAVYALAAMKFSSLKDFERNRAAPWPVLLCFYLSAWYCKRLDLLKGVEDSKDVKQAIGKIRDALAEENPQPLGQLFKTKSVDLTKLLRFLRMARRKGWIEDLLYYVRAHGIGDNSECNDFVAAIVEASRSRNVQRVTWDKPAYDVASTGGASNITPLLGFLYLRAIQEPQEQENAEAIRTLSFYIPKISSRGDSGGTIDVLESVGLNAELSFDDFCQHVRDRGWGITSATQDICEVDRILMGARKRIGLMKVPDLTVASIAAKKVFVGCTRFLVDGKRGYDSKLIVNEPIEDQETPTIKADPPSDDNWRKNWSWLGEEHTVGKEAKSCWFWTSSEVLQCRAIGRKLLVMHLLDLLGLSKKTNPPEEKGSKVPAHLMTFCEEFGKRLTSFFDGLHFSSVTLERLGPCLASLLFPDEKDQTQQQTMATDNHAKLQKYYRIKESDPGFSKKIGKNIGDGGLYRYDIVPDWIIPLEVPKKKLKLKVSRIDVAYFDDLYERLCRGRKHDPDVGLYFHVLPGECVEAGQPLLSIFYREGSLSPAQLEQCRQRILFEKIKFEGVSGAS